MFEQRAILVQVVMLGSGVEEYETRMRQMEGAYGNHFRCAFRHRLGQIVDHPWCA